MGSIFKRGRKWYIDYYDPNGKRIRESVSHYKEAAQKALMKVEIAIAEDKYLDVKRHEPITFKDFAEKFRRKHIRRRNKSFRNQEYLLDGLVKHFGSKMMHEITTNDMDHYLEQRQEHTQPSTVNSDLTMLKSLFNRANEWDDLSEYNPARNIKKLEENNERCRYLTEEEQDKLLDACSGVLRTVVLVALRTGLRWGEIINLKWQQALSSNYVDFENNTIFIHESLAKSKKSRHVPLSPSVKQALMDFPQRSETGYIFVNPKTGKRIVTLKKSFHTALMEARIENFRFHDLRHCFASDLVRKGVDLYVVQRLLGHSSPKMTQRYAHLSDDHLKEAIHVLDGKKDVFCDFGLTLDTVESSSFKNKTIGL